MIDNGNTDNIGHRVEEDQKLQHLEGMSIGVYK